MAADEGDCVVQVVSAFSDEGLCWLQLPSSGTVLYVKRRVQAAAERLEPAQELQLRLALRELEHVDELLHLAQERIRALGRRRARRVVGVQLLVVARREHGARPMANRGDGPERKAV